MSETKSNTKVLVAAVVLSVSAIGAGVYLGNRNGTEAERINPAAVVTPQAPAKTEDVAAVPQTAVQPSIPEVETPELPKAEEPEISEPEVEQSANLPEAPDTPVPPSIDEVRVEPDGLTVIAGRALPGSTVAILLDGVENTAAVAEPTGAFAAVTLLVPTPDPQVLTIVQRDGDSEIASVDEVILAPIAVPTQEEVVAEADIEQPVEPDAEPAVSEVASNEALDTGEAAQETDAVAAAEPTEETEAVELAESTETQGTIVGTEVSELSAPGVEGDVAALTTPAAEETDLPLTTANLGDAPETETQLALVDPNVTRSPAPLDRAAPDEPDTPGLPEGQVATSGELDTVSQPDLPKETVEPTTSELGTQTSQQIAVLRSTVSGVEVLAPGPELLENVSIDTISYSTEGEVQLAGRAQQDARTVRVYLDNAPIATLDVDPDGRWRGELPDVDTGIYRLRVDELGPEGAVTSRLETPFKREDPDVLEAAQTDDTAKARRITVQTGNTLWAIARDRYGEGLLYVQIFEANKNSIRDPDLIFPGQVFDLPE